jgi:hypothetical protein
VLELTYTAWDLKPFAEDLDFHGEPFRWDEVRRALLRAELDAYYAALYGLTRDELRYILDPQDVYGPDFPGETFRVLKQNEIKKYGEYRTRRLVLEAWDRLGLEPRNRDGRYVTDDRSRAPSTTTTTASMTMEPPAAPRSRAGSDHLGVASMPVRPVSGKPAARMAVADGVDRTLREKTLNLCVTALKSGRLTAAQLAARFRFVDPRVDPDLVISVLTSEGRGLVTREHSSSDDSDLFALA